MDLFYEILMPKLGGDKGDRDAGLPVVYRPYRSSVKSGYAVMESLPMPLLRGGAGGY